METEVNGAHRTILDGKTGFPSLKGWRDAGLTLPKRGPFSARSAFTLMELLVTLTLITIAMSIGIYGYRLAIPHARSFACRQNLHDLGRALQLYLTDHQEVMPVLAAGRSSKSERDKPTLDTILLPYLDNPESLRCPCDHKNFYENSGTSYYWNSVLNGQKSFNLRFLLTWDETLIPVISDKEGFHKGVGNGVNILYANGRVDKEIRFQVGR
jgi:prepilin-type N-terminal cleavage/methylation domain-containing protein